MTKPRRYIDFSEAKSALRRGRSVEALVGFFEHEEGPAVRLVVISLENDELWLRMYESLEVDYTDFYGFPEADPNLEQGAPTLARQFPTLQEALTWLDREFPGSSGKLVNQGVAEAEYWNAKGVSI